MFCSHCGAPVALQDAFCSRCGQAARAVLPQVVEVKGVLGLGTRFWNLVVVEDGLILANQPEVLEEKMDELGEVLEAALLAAGTQWRQRADNYEFSPAPWDCYLAMEDAEILAEDRHNRMIPRQDIRAVRLRLDDDPESHSDTLVLETREGTTELDLPWGNGNLARRLLSRFGPVQGES